MDYYWAQNGNNITGCVYDLIRFKRLAALVILAGDLYDTQKQEEIIHKAGMQKIPVFWQGGIHSGCISISTDYEAAYKAVIRHVVREYGEKTGSEVDISSISSYKAMNKIITGKLDEDDQGTHHRKEKSPVSTES